MELRREVSVRNRLGLHVRPATLLAQKANSFKSDIFIEKDGLRVNAKSCIEILTVAATEGTKMYLVCRGADAKEAMSQLSKMFESAFGERKK